MIWIWSKIVYWKDIHDNSIVIITVNYSANICYLGVFWLPSPRPVHAKQFFFSFSFEGDRPEKGLKIWPKFKTQNLHFEYFLEIKTTRAFYPILIPNTPTICKENKLLHIVCMGVQ